jgi:hypothetical protein
MINKNINSKKQTQPQRQSPTPGAPAPAPHKARTIKLGVDVHLDVYVLVRIIPPDARPAAAVGTSTTALDTTRVTACNGCVTGRREPFLIGNVTV